MLKVLQITVSAGFGGGPQHVHDLVSNMGSEVIVDIACPYQEPFWDRFKTTICGEMVEIPERRFTLLAAFNLVRHVRKRGINLLHSHGKGAGVYGRFVSAMTGVPLVHTPHGIHLDQYNRLMKRVYLAYERVTGRLINYTIFVSESEKARAKELGLWSTVPSHVIANGVRAWPDRVVRKWRRELRHKLGIQDTEIVVATLTRFNFAKNMQEMTTIAENQKGVRFWFIGDGPDRQVVEDYCESHDLDYVWFPGLVPDPARYLAAADIYLSTSRWEGLPLSVLEAMALTKPIVASAVIGNIDAVRDNVTGYLYELGDIKLAVERLSKLATDKKLRVRMGQAAHRRQQDTFSVELMVERTIGVYQEVAVDK